MLGLLLPLVRRVRLLQLKSLLRLHTAALEAGQPCHLQQMLSVHQQRVLLQPAVHLLRPQQQRLQQLRFYQFSQQ